jgi:hypothetical protein
MFASCVVVPGYYRLSKRIQLYLVIDILIVRYAHMANYTVIMYEGWDQRAEPSIKMQR